MSNTYKICSRCIMDTTSDPNLILDDNGVCNYCHEYDNNLLKIKDIKENGEEKLKVLFNKIKEECKNDEYDCILGISGGVDSSYVAHMATQYGLRILAVHVDAGWNSEIAVQNIQKMCEKLGIDLHTVVIDWSTMKELQRAYLFSGLANQDVPQDHCFVAVIKKYAQKHRIKYVLNGGNWATEGILSTAYQYTFADWKSIKDVYKKNGRGKSLRKYPHMNLLDIYGISDRILGIKEIRPLNYINYSKKDALALLEKEYGWKYYGGKHYESRFTKFFQEVYLPQKFGWYKVRDHISSLIVGGEMSREEGLHEMNQILSKGYDIEEETEYVLKKLDISYREWENILSDNNKTEDDYRNIKGAVNMIKKIIKPFMNGYK